MIASVTSSSISVKARRNFFAAIACMTRPSTYHNCCAR
jgi:hypothetical protein